jgi:hypothetical protein
MDFLLEVNRIKEIMSIRSLINEQWNNVVDDVIKYGTKLGKNLSDDVDELLRGLKNSTNDEEALTYLVKLANSSDELSNFIIPKVMETISQQENKLISNVKEWLSTQIKNKKIDINQAKIMSRNWIDKNVQTEFKGVKDIILKDLNDFIDDTVKKGDVPEVIPQTKKTITDVAGQTLNDVKPLTNEEISNLENLYRQKGFASTYVMNMRKFAKWLSDSFTSQTKLFDELLKLVKSYTTELNPAKKTDILNRINDLVITIEQKDKSNYVVINEWIDTNVLDYKIKNKIKDLDGYKKAASVFDGTALETWKKEYGGLQTRVGKFRNQFLNFIFKSGKKTFQTENWVKGVVQKYKQLFIGKEYAELRRYLILQQTTSWKGWKEFVTQFGVPKAVQELGKEWARNYLIEGLALGFLYYAKDFISHLLVSGNVPYVSKLDSIKKNSDNFETNYGITKKSESRSELVKNGIFSLISGWGESTLNVLNNLNVAFPGLLDDFFILFETGRELEPNEENLKSYEQKIDDLINSTKSKLKDISDSAQQELQKRGTTPQQPGQQQTPPQQTGQNKPATDASSINIDDYMK